MERVNSEIQDALAGVVASVRTPFTRNGDIDFAGLRKYIDFIVDAGSRVAILTYGDSLFSLLTSAEILEVTKVVRDQTANRIPLCAATGIWPTKQTVAFAETCRELGVDILMVLPPDWGKSGSVDTLVSHYAAAAEVLPVMVVTNLFKLRGDAFGLKVVEELFERVPGVVAVKDDVAGEFGRRLCSLVSDRMTVISGGQKRTHLDLSAYGCAGHMSPYITFKPEIAHLYWKSISSGDYPAAAEIISNYEVPLFNHLMNCSGGFDAGLHGIYEIVGIYERWRRAPYENLNESEMEVLADVCRELTIL